SRLGLRSRRRQPPSLTTQSVHPIFSRCWRCVPPTLLSQRQCHFHWLIRPYITSERRAVPLKILRRRETIPICLDRIQHRDENRHGTAHPQPARENRAAREC